MKSIIAKQPEGKEFEIVPAGNYIARCYSMIQLGTHKSEYQGQMKTRERVRITWELPTELREDGKPFVIGAEYTLSLSEMGNLRSMLESWRGRAFNPDELEAFDIVKVLEVPCMINVIHSKSKDGSKTYANIATVSPLPKLMICPKQVNPTVVVTTEDFWNKELMETLPEFIQKKIKESMEYNGEVDARPEVFKEDEEIQIDFTEKTPNQNPGIVTEGL